MLKRRRWQMCMPLARNSAPYFYMDFAEECRAQRQEATALGGCRSTESRQEWSLAVGHHSLPLCPPYGEQISIYMGTLMGTVGPRTYHN